MTDINSLTEKIIKFRDERGWKEHHTPKNQAIALMIEAGELLEIFNYSPTDKIPEGQKKHLEEELIDVFYWLLIIAHDNKIDISEAFKRKMEKNVKKYPLAVNPL